MDVRKFPNCCSAIRGSSLIPITSTFSPLRYFSMMFHVSLVLLYGLQYVKRVSPCSKVANSLAARRACRSPLFVVFVVGFNIGIHPQKGKEHFGHGKNNTLRIRMSRCFPWGSFHNHLWLTMGMFLPFHEVAIPNQ